MKIHLRRDKSRKISKLYVPFQWNSRVFIRSAAYYRQTVKNV
jgi:hypothetical protein